MEFIRIGMTEDKRQKGIPETGSFSPAVTFRCDIAGAHWMPSASSTTASDSRCYVRRI